MCRRRAGGFGFVRPIRAGLEGSQDRRRPGYSHVGVDLALKDLPGEDDVIAFNTKPDAISDEGLSERGCKFWCEVADLICMTQEEEEWIEFPHSLLKRGYVTIRSVFGKLVVFDRVNRVEFLRGRVGGDTLDGFAEHDRRQFLSGRRRDALRGDHCLKGCAIQNTVSLFYEKEYSLAH